MVMPRSGVAHLHHHVEESALPGVRALGRIARTVLSFQVSMETGLGRSGGGDGEHHQLLLEQELIERAHDDERAHHHVPAEFE